MVLKFATPIFKKAFSCLYDWNWQSKHRKYVRMQKGRFLEYVTKMLCFVQKLLKSILSENTTLKFYFDLCRRPKQTNFRLTTVLLFFLRSLFWFLLTLNEQHICLYLILSFFISSLSHTQSHTIHISFSLTHTHTLSLYFYYRTLTSSHKH